MTTKLSIEDAAKRHGQAVVDSNMAQVMADLAPEAMAGAMALGAVLQGVTKYEVVSKNADGADHVIQIKYTTASGDATVQSRWRATGDEWKIVEVAKL